CTISSSLIPYTTLFRSQFQKELDIIIANAIREDVGDGDHSSLACIPSTATGRAKLLVKDEGILAGVDFAKQVFAYVDPNLAIERSEEHTSALQSRENLV